MGKRKKKVAKLTEEQYNAYIMSLKNDAALYTATGEAFVPPEIKREEEKRDF